MSSRLRRWVLETALAEAPRGDDGAPRLPETAHHYLTHVLRLAEGDGLEIVDGDGVLWRGTVGWREGHAHLCGAERVATATAAPLVLAAALIKAPRWEALVEKAAELGASSIVPIEAERSVVQIADTKRTAKTERWQRIADAATRQSRRSDRLHVADPCPLATALAAAADAVVLCADTSTPEAPWPPSVDAPVWIFIGPEGGWSETERALLGSSGAHFVGLGASVLRAETAGIAALAAVRLRRCGAL